MFLDQAPLLQLFQLAAEHSREAIAILDREKNAVLWHNPAFRHSCQTSGELVGKSLQEILPDQRDSAPGIAPGWQCFDEGEYRLVVLTDPRRYDGADPLTGAADRAQLERRLAELWEAACAPGSPLLALLFIDLNNFKQINDTWGHPTGDVALRQVARRFRVALRADDFLARYGGDEFVVLLTGWRSREDVGIVIQRLCDALRKPLELSENSASVTASIGVAYSTDGYSSPEALLHAADRAMFSAKARSSTDASVASGDVAPNSELD